jgi:hypothetical protein
MKIKFVLPILVMILGLLLPGLAARAADLVIPDPSIAPEEVVAIQMKALQFNDNPTPDFGIAQTWNFAHPRNRAMTGPLPRFASMLKAPGYGSMLNHASHRIVAVPGDDNRATFDVFMETSTGQVLLFNWAVELVEGGEFDNCWMTVAVSMPRLAGQGS